MHHPSVQRLLEIGTDMLNALDAGDVDRFSDLLETRGRLVRGLSADFQTDGLSDADASALAAQSSRLEDSMRTTRLGLGAAVSAVSRFRTARHTYRQRPGVVEGRLNKSLRG